MKSQIIQEIETALQNENFSEALQASDRLVNTYPNDVDSYLKAGDTYAAMNSWSKAIGFYEKALAISPNNALVYYKLSVGYELKEDLTIALEMSQVARRLEPTNCTYVGLYGKLLHEKGRCTNNINLTKEGRELMESAMVAGETDRTVKDQLAIAYLEECLSNWAVDPQNKEERLATERWHLDYTQAELEKAKSLTDGSNVSINNRIQELEAHLHGMEKRKYYGYNFLLKASIVSGLVVMAFGATGFGIFLLVMAGLYYASQMKPGYIFNRMYVKNSDRDPFIIRRIKAVAEQIGSISIFGSFMDIIMFKLFTRLAFNFITYGMAIMLLPYEIFKGFWVNYDLQHKMMAKTAA